MTREQEPLGLHLSIQHPSDEDARRIPVSRDEQGNVIYPELDADRDHVHFEMVPMSGESLLWLTLRRGIEPKLASHSLRKIANLIDRHGLNILNLAQGKEGSFSSQGALIQGPLKLRYDHNGDLVFPPRS
jgi:hypothetical protein